MTYIKFLLLGGLPLILCVLCGIFIWQNQERKNQVSLFLLRFNIFFCTLMWGCIYIEYYTVGNIYLFDAAAPLISLIAVLVLPITNITHLILQSKEKSKLYRTEIILTYLLSLVSILPGLFGIIFLILSINSDR